LIALYAVAIGLLLSPAGLAEIQAAPFRIVYPLPLAAEARSLAAAVPGTVERLSSALGAPPLPDATLYLLADDDGRDVPHAGLMPDWAAGIAIPGAETTIIRVDRVGPYGQRQLLGVLAHETAHLLMARAAGRGASLMPAWFEEGVSSNLARDGEWMEFLYLWLSPVAASGRPLATLEGCFGSMDNPALRRAAYAGSYSFVRFAMGRHDAGLPARVLAGLASGHDFERSWGLAAMTSLADDERAWSASIRGSRRWFAILTSSFALWIAITLLLLVAYRIKRSRSRRILEGWQEEDPFA